MPSVERASAAASSLLGGLETPSLESAEPVAEAALDRFVSRLTFEPLEPLLELGELCPAEARRDGAAFARRQALVQVRLAPSELVALRCELGLCPRERLLRLLQRFQPCLDLGEPLFRIDGLPGGTSGEIGLELHERTFAGDEIGFALVQLLGVGRQADLRVVQCRLRPGWKRLPRSAPRLRESVGELTLPALHRRDALGQLGPQSRELLLGSDPHRMQTLLLAANGQLLVVTPTEEGHADDDRPPGRRPSGSLRCAYAARSRRSSARARRTISSRSPKRSRAFSWRSDSQRSSSCASSSLISVATVGSSPSERRCQRSWRFSESCSISV